MPMDFPYFGAIDSRQPVQIQLEQRNKSQIMPVAIRINLHQTFISSSK